MEWRDGPDKDTPDPRCALKGEVGSTPSALEPDAVRRLTPPGRPDVYTTPHYTTLLLAKSQEPRAKRAGKLERGDITVTEAGRGRTRAFQQPGCPAERQGCRATLAPCHVPSHKRHILMYVSHPDKARIGQSWRGARLGPQRRALNPSYALCIKSSFRASGPALRRHVAISPHQGRRPVRACTSPRRRGRDLVPGCHFIFRLACRPCARIGHHTP